jgi:hypothetical protein
MGVAPACLYQALKYRWELSEGTGCERQQMPLNESLNEYV